MRMPCGYLGKKQREKMTVMIDNNDVRGKWRSLKKLKKILNQKNKS